MFKVIVGGDIGFKDEGLFKRFIEKVLSRKKKVQFVIGADHGASMLARSYAHTHYHVGIKNIGSEVGICGDLARYRQNKRMCAHADALIAFWDGEDKYTRSLIRSAEVRGLKIRVCRYQKR